MALHTSRSCVLSLGVDWPRRIQPSKMSISTTTVSRIAQLARIAISTDDLHALSVELSRVLNLADQLNAAEIAGIEPMAHPLEAGSVPRADIVTEHDQSEAFLALAPQTQAGLYLVPKVIE